MKRRSVDQNGIEKALEKQENTKIYAPFSILVLQLPETNKMHVRCPDTFV